ncbi:putative pterin-4-alpha-carbinolamine dehydratase, chloroplastic [Cocos nucifera]|uniref:4a-hydroxytetrahydrobiopterin dehydratase n=1 Tax=Cocos nucifera TaxID=13894 RepID=A0A8K0N2Y0_COCNU|nr:putative pterin-4-alpha-carbinolamine dehydratase, chloroplastic [Cocos nucifera]
MALLCLFLLLIVVLLASFWPLVMEVRVMEVRTALVQGWNLVSEDGVMKLHRSWKVKSFTKGLEFFQLVADVAEAEGHHPDLHLVGWNNAKIDIWTHSIGGLTENDFILAAKINSIHVEHLLRRKAAV